LCLRLSECENIFLLFANTRIHFFLDSIDILNGIMILKFTEVVILTKRKSMGMPKSQRIRMDGPNTPTGPLISEICPAQANDLKPRPRVPKYKIRGEPVKGKLQKMVAELNLPDVVGLSELSLFPVHLYYLI
jgi:hypothetical protein